MFFFLYYFLSTCPANNCISIFCITTLTDTVSEVMLVHHTMLLQKQSLSSFANQYDISLQDEEDDHLYLDNHCCLKYP